MRSKRTLVLSLVILVLGLLTVFAVTGCGSSDDSSTTTAAETSTTAATTATTAPATETTAASTETTAGATVTSAGFSGTFDGTIKIGALGSMTGGNAMNGAETIWAQEKAVEDINAAGGIVLDGKHMEIELVFVDDKSDPNEGAAAVEKLIKVENVKLILSTMVSSINMPAAIVAEKYQALYHQVGTWSSVAREQNWQWSTDIFYSPRDAAGMPFLLWTKQPADATWSKWCVLNEDNADGQAFGAGMKAAAEAFHATIVASETFSPGTKDFSAVIMKFKEAGGDALVTLQAPPDAITFAKQLEEQNWSPVFTTDLSTALPDYAIAAIREALPAFEKQIKGFAMDDALLTGVETRTSSPIRVKRGEDYQSINIKGLYPAGEGAGYAGGILSAAVDGIEVAEAVALDMVKT